MKVAVIGAGLVGVTTAHYLRALDFDVHVFESESEPASKTSKANAGQLSYSFTDAMADPSLLPKLPAIMLGRDPAFRIYPSLRPKLVSWSCKFLLNCTQSRAAKNSLSLLRTALASAELMKEFHERFGPAYQYQRAGKIVILPDEVTPRTQLQIKIKQQQGCDVSIIPYEQAVDIEPSLAAWKVKPQSAIYAPGDEVGDSNKFTHALAKELEGQGVKFHFNTPIIKLEKDQDQVARVITASSTETVDAVVVCTGGAERNLLSPLGLSLPIYPMAGYSLTLPSVEQSPTTSITALNRKIVFSRLGESVRVAGFADINAPIKSHPKRLKQLLHAAIDLAPAAANYTTVDKNAWAGFRPMTPDSLPIVGQSVVPGLFLNTGHGMLGWTLCAATGKEIAGQLVNHYQKRKYANGR